MKTQLRLKTSSPLLWPCSVGSCYGTVQAVLPPIGELEASFAVHFTLFVIFAAAILPLYRRPGRITATAFYVAVLLLAVVMPFKLFDERADLGTTQVMLSDLPLRMQESGYPLRVRDPLPKGVVIRLGQPAPTLRQLDQARYRQAGYRLRFVPVCGNAVGLSFLWGPRVSHRHLMLVATDRVAAALRPGA